MKNYAQRIAAWLLAGAACFSPCSAQAAQPVSGKHAEAERWHALALKDEHGDIPVHGMLDAVAQRGAVLRYSQMRRKVATPATAQAAGISSAQWTAIGPGNIGGRVRGMVIHPTNTAKIWIGGVSGGIWATSDAGQSWHAVNDALPNLMITTLAMSPTDPNTMYAGTGEVYSQITNDNARGIGIYKSTDGGNTWNRLTATDPAADPGWGFVNKVAIQPANGNLILAATEAGLYRSTDAGATWAQVLANNPKVKDVAFDPTDASKVMIGGSDGSIAYSNDAGATFTSVSVNSGGKMTAIAIAKSTAGVAYASMDLNSGTVFRTSDHGLTWTQTANPKHVADQGDWNNSLWVDPTDANHVVVVGTDIWRSTDAGANFTKISDWQATPVSPHADHHIFINDPGYNGTTNRKVYDGSDGGIYRANDITLATSSADPAASGWTNLNNGLAITQFYSGAGHAGSTIVGGAQDNGTLAWTGAGTDWREVYGGDGGFTAADPTDFKYVYGEYTNLLLFRSLDGGATNAATPPGYGVICAGILEGNSSKTTDSPPGCGGSGKANFIAPFILDPNNSSRMLAGAASLWMSNNVKADLPSWSAIKPPSTGATSNGDSNNISAIAVATGNSDIVWVGHNNGEVYKSTNATAAAPNWTLVSAALPQRFVTHILIDKDSPNTVYVTVGGFTSGNVQRTTDGGNTWTGISGNLPQVPVRIITRNPNNASQLYVGTEVGIFDSSDGGQTWSTSSDGPGNMSTDDLFWLDATTLVAATHGRGMFRTTVSNSVAAITPATGYWWNPAEPGRGFNIEKNGNNLFMASFLYDPSGRTTWYGVGPGAMSGNTFTGTLEAFSGGQTLSGAFKQAAAGPSGGAFSITFTSATQGSITWPGGTVPIQRYDFGPGGSAGTQPAGTPEAGWWWNSNEGGRGFAIEIQGNSLFLAGYMYDDQGNPVWYASGPTPLANSTTYQGTWLQFGNGQTLTGPYKAATVVNSNAGTVTIQFNSTTTGTMTMPDGRQIPIQRFRF